MGGSRVCFGRSCFIIIHFNESVKQATPSRSNLLQYFLFLLLLSALAVGNIPYDMTEEELIQIFSQVGTVVGMRLVFDRETGKPKGYGFCEFAGEYKFYLLSLPHPHHHPDPFPSLPTPQMQKQQHQPIETFKTQT